jgi:hypothetical protein
MTKLFITLIGITIFLSYWLGNKIFGNIDDRWYNKILNTLTGMFMLLSGGGIILAIIISLYEL